MAESGDEREEANNHDWSQLHSDLLRLIAGRVTRIYDFIRFRSVCRQWRSAGDPKLPRPQPPLLLLPRHPASDTCTFFSLFTGELHDVSLPAVAGQEIISAAHGWLILLDELTHRVLSLLNPITGAAIQLPPIKDFVDWRDIYIRRPILSSSPESEDCFVIVLHCYQQQDLVAFCQPGDEDWSVLKTGENPCDILYDEGRFLSIHEHRGNVFAIDSSAPEKLVEIPSLKAPKVWNEIRETFNLVKSDKKMFLWFWSYNLFSHYHKIRIYESDLNGLPKWSKFKSIGDNAFFNSAGQTLMCSLKDFPEFTKGCMYTTAPLDDLLQEGDDTKKIYVVDLKDGSYGWASYNWKLPEAFLIEPLWVPLSLF